MTRRTPTETFQPTPANSKHLSKLSKTRGLKSRTINSALTALFEKKNPLHDTIRRVLVDMNGPTGARAGDVKLLAEAVGLNLEDIL